MDGWDPRPNVHFYLITTLATSKSDIYFSFVNGYLKAKMK